MKFITYLDLKLKSYLPILLILISTMVVVFYPIIHISVADWGWTEMEYYLKYIPQPFTTLSFIKFYIFDQYGTTYALIEIPRLIFGYSQTGYYLSNVIFRLLAALSIYLLADYWSNKKILAAVASIFFAMGMPGIENTLWVVQFVAYIAVILLCLSLIFWRKFHVNPTVGNLLLSIFFLAVALFISHIRLHFLPIMLSIAEIYYLFKGKKQKIYNSLIFFHTLAIFLVFIILLLSFNTFKITDQIFRMVSPDILLSSLFNGYPPILHSYFLFISNLVINPNFLTKLGNILGTSSYLLNPNMVVIITALVSSIFLLLNLLKRNFLVAGATILAIIYPVSLWLSITKGYLTWGNDISSTTLLGGTLFFLIFLTISIVKKFDQKGAKLALLGFTIMITSLIFPWIAFPQMESNIQSAYSPEHRYYTLPLMGMSLVLGCLFSFCFESIKSSSIFKLKNVAYWAVILTISMFVVVNGILTQQKLTEWSQIFDKDKEEMMWKLVKPYFISIPDKTADRIVYFEGNLSEQDRTMVKQFLPHRLTLELKFTGKNSHNPRGNINNVHFIDNKEKIKKLFAGEAGIYQELNLIKLLSQDNFYAFKFDKNDLADIKSEIINELEL